MTGEIDARFWPKVDIREPDACWPWVAVINKKSGYGQFWTGERTAYAHRVMYEQARDDLPLQRQTQLSCVQTHGVSREGAS